MVSTFPFSIPYVPYFYLYPKPISMRLGEKKLIELCRNVIGLDPDKGYPFLFFNKLQNQIKLFYLDNTGCNEIIKLLPKGSFLMPVAAGNEKYIKIARSKLPSLFRM